MDSDREISAPGVRGAVLPVDPDVAIQGLASALHEAWRSHRALPNGGYEPRVKATSDEQWRLAHGVNLVDISNVHYDGLPADWQAENREAAGAVVGVLAGHPTVDLGDPRQRSAVGQQVHDAWLARNGWAAGGELDIPFDALPLDERDKDIHQVITALTTSAGSPRAASP
jgi:hypothetical protein